MIITLKNADFSLSNIGTLYSWRITRQMGAGAYYQGETSVLKGESFVATISLDEDYNIATNGITLTMGNQPINNYSISEDGKTITISIPSVTGNVFIKVMTESKGIDINNIVFDFDFTTKTFADYATQGIFTVPDASNIDGIIYNENYGANLNNNLPYGLTLINPIDASRPWVFEFTANIAKPTNLTGNRKALITGIDDLAPFIVINATSVESLGFQISSGNHTYVGSGKLIYDQEASYKFVHDGNNKTTVYQNGIELGSSNASWTGKTFGTILGVIQGKSTAYVWNDVEAGKKSYLRNMKFYYK